LVVSIRIKDHRAAVAERLLGILGVLHRLFRVVHDRAHGLIRGGIPDLLERGLEHVAHHPLVSVGGVLLSLPRPATRDHIAVALDQRIEVRPGAHGSGALLLLRPKYLVAIGPEVGVVVETAPEAREPVDTDLLTPLLGRLNIVQVVLEHDVLHFDGREFELELPLDRAKALQVVHGGLEVGPDPGQLVLLLGHAIEIGGKFGDSAGRQAADAFVAYAETEVGADVHAQPGIAGDLTHFLEMRVRQWIPEVVEGNGASFAFDLVNQPIVVRDVHLVPVRQILCL